MKICCKCKLEKNEDAFSKTKARKDGLQTQCKLCEKVYREEHKERIASYFQNNKKEIAEKKKVYYEATKLGTTEHRREYGANYLKEHPEYNKKYYENNKDKIKKTVAKYQIENKEKITKKQIEYSVKNPEKFKHLGKRWFCARVIKSIILDRDNYCCQLCNTTKLLQLHHILPVKSNYDEVLNPLNMIILCKNCHLVKAHMGSWNRLDEALSNTLLKLVEIKEKAVNTTISKYVSDIDN